MRLIKLFHSARHTRPKQLFHRLRLTARRRRSVRRAETLRARMLAAPLPALRLHESSPTPLMPPRTGRLEVLPDGFRITLLDESRTFGPRIDWNGPTVADATALWRMNLHYMEYLEEAGDEDFSRLVLDWIDHCPPYGHAYWLGDWNGFSVSIRCVVWMQQYAVRRGRLDSKVERRLLESLVRQLRFLADNLELDLGGNHLIKNVKALLWAAAFFDFREASEWGRLGRHHLRREIEEQLLADGLHYERSPAYHAQVFVDLLECHRCLDDGPLRTRLFDRLKHAARALSDTTHPDGYTSLFNDGGMHMAYLPGECLRAWHQLSGQTPPRPEVFALDAAGYYGLRGETDLVLVDCGDIAPDHLPAHGHGDILSFEWSIGGRRVIVDPGTFEYVAGRRREWSRATRAHNTVTLDDADQCEFWGSFRVARRAHPEVRRHVPRNGGFELVGRHDGFRVLRGRPVHQRRFDVAHDRILVEDEILGGAGQRVVARLMLHPDCKLERLPGAILIRVGEVEVVLETDAAIDERRVPWFPDFGVEVETAQLDLDYGAAPCRGSFLLRVRRVGV
jgi:uncharacterized heparinase superfamily protein